MSSNKLRKDVKRNKLVKDMREEYKSKEQLLKRIKDHPRVQVQVILKSEYGYGGSMIYDDALAKLSLDIKATELELGTKFEVINPVFSFQTFPEWRATKIEQAGRDLKEYKENFEELTKQVAKAKEDIAKQEVRIVARNKQILELFKEWKVETNS